ncbi:hypothetical protein ACHAXT_000330 [Thalassiosira profunda]
MQPSPRSMAALPPIGGAERTAAISANRLFTGGESRLNLSRTLSIRGGAASDGARGAVGIRGGTADNTGNTADNNIGRQYYLNKVYVDGKGETATSSILSIVWLVVSQSINVAAAVCVVSGYFGAWAASWLVDRLRRHYLPTVAENAAGGGESNSLFQGRYGLTTIASVGLLLLHVTGLQPNTTHSRASDAAFAGILLTYSHLVDPVFGGMIGCAHVALGVLSTILGSPLLVYGLDALRNVRFRKLGQYVGKEDPYVSDRAERISLVPVVQTRPRNEFVASITNLMGSASLLLAFPQYFLGLYMLGGVLVSWSSSKRLNWRFLERLTQWLGEGIRVSFDEATTGSIGKSSSRLMVLYWTLFLAKTAVAYAIMS